MVRLMVLIAAFCLIGNCYAASDQAKINALIAQINKEKGAPFSDESVAALVRCGVPALPAILREYDNAHEGVFMSLTAVLAKIDVPERDDAFMKAIGTFRQRMDERFSGDAYSLMLDSLAANHCTRAASVIRKFVSDPMVTGSEVGSHAIAALNALGQSLPPRPVETFLDLASTSVTLSGRPELLKVLPIMVATLDQAFQPSTSTLKLVSATPLPKIEVDDSLLPESLRTKRINTIITQMKRGKCCCFAFKGEFSAHKGTWGLDIILIDENEALVLPYYVRGSLWGRGYMGRLEQRNGRWLVIEWKDTWIS